MDQVPVIDFRTLKAGRVDLLRSACERWGVFQLTHHGIDRAIVDGGFDAAQAFFHRPSSEKNCVRRSEHNPWGFYDAELTKNTRDWKEIFDSGPTIGAWQPRWPAAPAGFRTAIEQWFQAGYRLCLELLDALALSLDLPGAQLRLGFEPNHTSFLRLNYYPQCAEPAAPAQQTTPVSGHLGVNHHTDSGALTALFQDAAEGLDVWHQDRWVAVPSRPDAVTVNLGDIAQVWSNDRYLAPLHRVRANSNRERFSAPFFLNPANDYRYAPLVAEQPPRYRPITWQEFREARAAGDYADYGAEVQISDYRVHQ